ncbi:MAG: hypothetical protein VB858_17490, partial [Planctomycetaceae bacterium]
KKTALQAGPRKIAVREGICRKKQEEISEQKTLISDVQKKADESHLQFKTNEQKIIEIKAKLNAASSNKEFDIFKGQIEADTAANAVLEDEYLELLEKVDAAREHFRSLESDLQEAVRLTEEIAGQVNAAEAGIRTDIEEIQKEVKTAETCVPSKLGEDYRRLVAAYGPGAIAVAEEGACTECFTELSAQYQLELRLGKVIRCRMCGRLLYGENSEQ